MKATVNITTDFKNDVTLVENSYFDTPFKIMNITEDKKANKLNLMLMSNSPGVLDEDEYSFNILVREKSNLQLFTQSYQRLFDMKKGACQQMNITVEDNAVFTYLPHPCVPHKNSIYRSHNKIYLSKNATLTWGEILTSGRNLHEETFAFTYLQNCTEIYVDGKLIVKENLIMAPSVLNPNEMGQLEGFTHQGSFIFCKKYDDFKNLSDIIYEWLQLNYSLPFGVSILPDSALLVRLLGTSAEEIMTCLQELNQLLQDFLQPTSTKKS